MPDLLDKFLSEINRAKLRVKRPTKFVFLCGGVILEQPEAPAANLRDFLWRHKKLGDRGAAYVLAESAQQLYRDSGYKDLITFEEDIARIAAVVLVISESAGSLAELGAFCSNDVISPVLRVLISEHNFGQESFIRWGPVERIRSTKRGRVGVFPWESATAAHGVEVSAETHFEDIEGFILEHVDAAPSTTNYPSDENVSIFYDILWCIYLADIVRPAHLLELVNRVHPELSQADLKRKLYTLKVAKWIGMLPYGGQDFYYLSNPQDPFQYSFNEGVKDKEPLRRVLAVRDALFENIPTGAMDRVRATRGVA